MYWRDIILLCHCMSLVEEKWHVDSRARLVLVPLLGPHIRQTSPNFNLPLFLLSTCTVCKAAMATSMDIDGTALGQPATLHSVPQVQEQPIIHSGLPLSNGRLLILISARFVDCGSARLDPCHVSGSQNREPFREIPVKVHIRRPDRDSWVYVGRATVSLDTTGHSSQVGESPYTYLHHFGQIV